MKLYQVRKKKLQKYKTSFEHGLLTDQERYNKIIDIWAGVSEKLAVNMMQLIKANKDGFNSIYMIGRLWSQR